MDKAAVRKPSSERRSLPSGGLGAHLSLLEEKCLSTGDRLMPAGRNRIPSERPAVGVSGWLSAFTVSKEIQVERILGSTIE